MNAVIAAAIQNKRTVLTTLALIFLLGTLSYLFITKDDNPDVPIPFFFVGISHDGISPEDAERLLIKPMEVELKSVEGLKEMTSVGLEGNANIYLEFDAGFDNEEALLDVREAVDRGKAELPDESDEPYVLEFNAAKFPIMTLVLYGEAPERSLIRVARQLKDDLEALPNVLEAQINGEREEVLEVIVDPTKLVTYNVSQSDLLDLVAANNQLVAAGSLETGQGRFAVKVPGLFETASDILELPVKTSEDGVVTLADITEVRRTFKQAASYARYNGQPAITIDVSKRVGTNVVDTAQMVRAVATASSEAWPGDIQVGLIWDQSVFTAEFLDTLRNSVLSAILLVVIVVVAAMGGRSAALVGVSIPGSFLCGIMLLYFAGYSVNTVVMFGLILSVGLLVDGAIVVSEYADRKMLEGEPKGRAYLLAAQRMAWPITSSTLTTLAAFLPLLFWPGIIGEWMKYLPITLIFTLASSLMMALIFLPTLGSLIGRPGIADARIMALLAGDHKLDLSEITGFTGWYARRLAVLIRQPGLVILSAFAVLLVVVTLFDFLNKGQVLFPDNQPDSVQLLVHARGNLSIDDLDSLVRETEQRVIGMEGVKAITARTGAVGGEDTAQDVGGIVTLIFENWQTRPPAQEIIDEARRRTATIPGIIVEPRVQQDGPVQGKDIQIKVSSEALQLIEPAAVALREHMERGMVGLVDVEDTRPLPGIEWVISVDRAEAGRYGTNIAAIGSFIQLVTNGTLVGKYRPDDADDEIDIRVRFPIDDRGIRELDNLRITTPQGSVPITNFVNRVARQSVTEVRRVDGDRVMEVKANVASKDITIDSKVREIKAWIAEQNFDPRLRITFAGADELQQESGTFLIQAFILAVFLMGIILITQFNSFYHAGLILIAVLLSTTGALFGLVVTGRPFVIVMTGVGIISLAGIVVNNNIVLIDTYARLVKAGMEPMEAIIRTGTQRLRPVLLTTITTVIGLLPMALSFNVDFFKPEVVIGSPTAFIWVDLALTVIFGLSFATVLTLVVTPSLLAFRFRLGDKVTQFRSRPPAEAPAE